MRPVIGIVLDWQESGSFSKRPHYALREAYFQSVYKAGGIPFGIPYIPSSVDEYLSKINGLIVPGGFYRFKDEWYEKSGNNNYDETPRVDFDIEIIKKALKKDMPVLGICAGMQIMACVFGGKLISDISAYINTEIDHLHEKPAEQVAHRIIVKEKSKLAAITGKHEFSVNTSHKEAVVSVPDNIEISALAEDGIVEAIELKDHKFAIGVQWHPEYLAAEEDILILKEFIKQAGK